MDGRYNNSPPVNAKPTGTLLPSELPASDNDSSHQSRVDAVYAQSTVLNAVQHSRDASQSSIHVEGSGRIVGSDADNAEFDLMFNDELYNFFDDESNGSRDFAFDLDNLSALPPASPSVVPQVPTPSQPDPPSIEPKEGALIWHNAATDKQHRESIIILM